jgi:HK97 family phage major capsid protein
MKELLEQRGILDNELKALTVKFEAKTLNETEEKRFDEVIAEIESLNSKIATAEKREAAVKEAEKRNLPKEGTFAIGGAKTDNEDQVKKEFRFVEAINLMAGKRNIEGFYKEMHEEGQRSMAKSGVDMTAEEGFVVPAFIIGNEKREMTSSTSDTSKAGYTIQTDLMTNWIDVLTNKILFPGMGANFMTGLQGNIAIPKKGILSGANWLTETEAITPADSTWTQVTMSPKRVGDATAFSMKLLAQSSLGIEGIVRNDLLDSIAQALQNAIIKGPSTGNSPLGILNTSGVGSVVINTNGGPITWAKVVELETNVANSNADIRNLGYLTNSKVRGAAKGIFRDTGSGMPIWDSNGTLNGYQTGVTNAVPSTNVKGSSGAVCSSLIFGDWSNLMIGQWGGLVLTANPYALDLSGQVRVSINAFFDTAVRQAAGFAVCNDITT